MSFGQLGRIEFDIAFRLIINISLFYINYKLILPKFLFNKSILHYTLISLLTLVTYNVFISLLPLSTPFDAIENLNYSGRFGFKFRNAKYIITMILSLSFYLLGGVYGLIENYYHRQKIERDIEISKTDTELQFLKAQLNPHFLFNSLNSIYSLVRNNSLEAPEAVITLSELMRYMVYEANKVQVPLKKEIEYIQNYIKLQKLRLANNQYVIIKVVGDPNPYHISPLIFISFIENAFKYGTDYKGVTHVDILITIVRQRIIFNVSNMIGVFEKDKKNSGIGLTNIKNRLELLYPNSHELDIHKDDYHYKVELSLKLHQV
ncbi:sensor histidine kinase [Gangjinia marincola]|uniref:Sensor histidine kinase n=1 Tax=Gangjinia marincola TaxID=578463 RepID=A0ABP3XY39_9FLAO